MGGARRATLGTVRRCSPQILDQPVGLPFLFSQMRIVREDGTECIPGESGEIIGRGPLQMVGYHARPDLTDEVVCDGWTHTGDMRYADNEGFLYLVDRKKDMIDSGGVKVYPRDIEEVVARHPAVSDVAVFGVPDAKWGGNAYGRRAFYLCGRNRSRTTA